MQPENHPMEEITDDMTEGNAAAILRENLRMRGDIKDYKGSLKRKLTIIFLLTLLLVFQTFAYLYWYPKYRYAQTRDNSVICDINMKDAPNITHPTLTEFAKEAAVHAYTFDYINYRTSVNEAGAKYFSKNGFKAYMHTLQESKNLERVINNRLVLRAMGDRVPQLEEEGFNGKNKYWLVLVPIVIEFYSGGKLHPESKQKFIAHVTIFKTQATYLNRDGIEVDSMVLKPDVN